MNDACPDEHGLRSVADLTATPAVRFTLLDHVTRCASCRQKLEVLRGPQPRTLPTRHSSAWRNGRLWSVTAIVVLIVLTLVYRAQQK